MAAQSVASYAASKISRANVAVFEVVSPPNFLQVLLEEGTQGFSDRHPVQDLLPNCSVGFTGKNFCNTRRSQVGTSRTVPSLRIHAQPICSASHPTRNHHAQRIRPSCTIASPAAAPRSRSGSPDCHCHNCPPGFRAKEPRQNKLPEIQLVRGRIM